VTPAVAMGLAIESTPPQFAEEGPRLTKVLPGAAGPLSMQLDSSVPSWLFFARHILSPPLNSRRTAYLVDVIFLPSLSEVH